MTTESPWDGLPVAPAGELEARRADASHPYAFFFARNAQGDLLLTLQVSCRNWEPGTIPVLRGLEVQWLPAFGRLQVRLVAAGDRDMFAVLCRDLLAWTSAARSDEECMERTLARLARWQRLLSRGRTKLLTEEQIRGLFAELLFLRDELLPRFGALAVLAWKGPQGYPQDFALDGFAVEVKSHLVGAAAEVRISSPEQLHAPGAELILRVQRLAVSSEDGANLVALVREITAMLQDHPEELASFELSLSEVGYHDAPDYESYRLSSEGVDTYLVEGGFPRITPDDVPEGVCGVSYSIRLPALAGHRSEIGWNDTGAEA